MKILVSGSSGMLGTALLASLRADGHTIGCLVRPGRPAGAGDVQWDPVANTLDLTAAEGADALVNLAGASIGEGRWSAARKKILRSSRVDATRSLVEQLSKLRRPPAAFLSSSATGYYGNRGDETLTESSAPGDDFLAQLARDWEAEAQHAASFGARTVILRFGVILAAHGGALPRMLMPFRLGLGGRLGSGEQWMSWLALEDAVGIIRYTLAAPELRGPVNAVAPNPVRNVEFTRILARTLHRPAFFPAPSFALRLALGEMAEALLLASQRALPERLSGLGYSFLKPQLEPALRGNLPQRE